MNARRPTIELDGVKLGVAAALSAIVFVAGLAWVARGIVSDLSFAQLSAENRITAAIERRYFELAGRVLLIEDRLGIQGGGIAPARETVSPASGRP